MIEAMPFFDAARSLRTDEGGHKCTGREKAHNTFFAILDRIAEIVQAFPCLYFRVRLAFRQGTVTVRLSQMRSAFLAGLSGGVQKFYCAHSPLCRPP